MKNKKFLLIVVGLLTIFAMLASCTPTPATEEVTSATEEATTAATEAATEVATEEMTSAPAKQYKIGFSHSNLTIAWMAELQTHVEKKAEELGVELIVTNANDDPQQQITDVENLLSQGIDGLLIVPVDSQSAVTLVDMATEKGVPVTCASRAIPSPDVVSFATGDDYEAGKLVGQYFADELGGKGKIVLLLGQLGLDPVIKRMTGFKEVLEQYPDMEIVSEQVADNNRAKAVSIMENILTAQPEIDAVFGTNDEMALGSYIAMKAAGRGDEALIATVGGHMETYTSIKNHEMDAVVFYPNTMGARALELLVDYLNGEEVPQVEVVPSVLITIQNVDEYIEALQP